VASADDIRVVFNPKHRATQERAVRALEAASARYEAALDAHQKAEEVKATSRKRFEGALLNAYRAGVEVETIAATDPTARYMLSYVLGSEARRIDPTTS
jgi:hypothetical protein